MQELGLSLDYKEDKDIKLFCGMLDGLAFLPLDKVTEGMLVIRNCIPIKSHDKLQELVDYFDTTYVSGPFRRVQLPPARSDTVAASVRLRRLAPLFAPAVWNVHEATLTGEARANNLCESWNYGFQQLVGHTNPSVWTIIDSMRKDQALVATTLLQAEQGIKTVKRVNRVTIDLQDRLHNLCQEF